MIDWFNHIFHIREAVYWFNLTDWALEFSQHLSNHIATPWQPSTKPAASQQVLSRQAALTFPFKVSALLTLENHCKKDFPKF